MTFYNSKALKGTFSETVDQRACLHGGGKPQAGEVTCLAMVKKQSYNLWILMCSFKRLLLHLQMYRWVKYQ